MKKKNYWYVYLIVYLLILLLAYLMTYMPGKSYSGAIPEISLDQKSLAITYKNQLEKFATVPRNESHMKGLEDAESFIVQELKKLNVEINEQSYGSNNQFKNIEVNFPAKEKHLKTV